MRTPTVLALVLLFGCGTPGPAANPQLAATDDEAAAKFKSPIKTAFVIVLENQNWSDVKGSASAPYINQTLLTLGAHAEQYLNVPKVHPSEPNYLWMEAGTNFGILADGTPATDHQSSTKHLTRLLQNKSIAWKSYQENITGKTCPLTASGLYAPKHNPMVYFDDITDSRSASSANCIAHVRPYSELSSDLAKGTVAPYNFITPNLCDDGHNTSGCQSSNSLANADGWLASNVPLIMASQAYQNDGAIFITWDESEGGDFPIGMIVLSPLVHGGYSNTVKYSHSSLLRTLEEIFNVTPLLGDATKATDLLDLFQGVPEGGTSSGSSSGGSSSAGSSSGSSSGSGSTTSGSSSGGGSLARLRIMEGNLSSGTNQSYDNGEGGRIFHGLNPDVATIQEFNFGDNSTTAIRGFVDTNFGTEYSYFRETVAGSGTLPNGIVSRYPILQSGSWADPNVANRGFAYVEIDIPGSTNLWVISTHMLTTTAANRDAEAQNIVADIKAHVPAADYVVVGGDFNTATRTEACMSSYAAEFTVTGPYPADNNGNTNTSEPRSKPHDWIITSAALTAKEIPVLVGKNSFANGLVVDTAVYTPLSDLAPAELGDSHASGEQHMGVVKDFAL